MKKISPVVGFALCQMHGGTSSAKRTAACLKPVAVEAVARRCHSRCIRQIASPIIDTNPVPHADGKARVQQLKTAHSATLGVVQHHCQV